MQKAPQGNPCGAFCMLYCVLALIHSKHLFMLAYYPQT